MVFLLLRILKLEEKSLEFVVPYGMILLFRILEHLVFILNAHDQYHFQAMLPYNA